MATAWWKLAAIFVAGGLVGALSIVQVVPQGTLAGRTGGAGLPGEEGEIVAGEEGAGGPLAEGVAGTAGSTRSSAGGGKAGTGSLTAGPAGLECKAGKNAAGAYKNGGKTDDKGVTGTRIKLATTVVRSGFASGFLGEVEFGMEAVRKKVNDEGGICGRLIDIELKDDQWNAQTGQQYLTNFMEGDYFAIPVGPSSEGLNKVIRDKSGGVSKYGMPVVGTDGMVVSQYTHPWVWPVAVSTASSARIMVIDAIERRGITNRNDFSIVFDRDYKFGQEAAEAFNDEVKARFGGDVLGYPGPTGSYSCGKLGDGRKTHFCGIDANQSTGYGAQVESFEVTPNGFVAYFMEPTTALQWVYSTGYNIPGSKVAAAQPLFTRAFGNDCQTKCHDAMVWTGFRPYIENYKNEKPMQDYVSDLRTWANCSSCDESNAFTEAGYVGMRLLVDALKQVGPNLTRARLRAVLDSMALSTGHTMQETIKWSAGNHFSAATMRGFTMKYTTTYSCCQVGPIVSDPDPQKTEQRLPDKIRN